MATSACFLLEGSMWYIAQPHSFRPAAHRQQLAKMISVRSWQFWHMPTVPLKTHHSWCRYKHMKVSEDVSLSTKLNQA